METYSAKMLSDFKRMLRYYPKAEAPAHMVNYVVERFVPKINSEDPRRAAELKSESMGPEGVINVVIGYYRVSIEDLRRRCRVRKFITPRHVCMYLLATRTRMSLKSIGDVFGGLDHTTVMHARDSVSKLIQSNEDFRKEVEFLNSLI